jgi:hypothetical protein
MAPFKSSSVEGVTVLACTVPDRADGVKSAGTGGQGACSEQKIFYLSSRSL